MAPVFLKGYNRDPSRNLCCLVPVTSRISQSPHGVHLLLYSLHDESKWLDCHRWNTVYDVDDHSESDSTIHAPGNQWTGQDWWCGSLYWECKSLLIPSLKLSSFSLDHYHPLHFIDRSLGLAVFNFLGNSHRSCRNNHRCNFTWSGPIGGRKLGVGLNTRWKGPLPYPWTPKPGL